jgi:quinol monooxygenase YgiN
MQTATDHKATPSSTPGAAAVATHEVRDYAAWKKVFDEHAATRTRSGILGTHINRAAENPNLVSLYLAAKDAASLHAFLGSEDLKATMQHAGVQGAPSIAFVTPVEDMAVKNRPLPGAIAKLRVADYDTWKKAFDTHGATRAKAGIVGHAINRGVDDPNVVVLYLQANSADPLKAFLASQDLKDTMAKAGVEGAPQIALVQGADWGP